MTVVVWYQLFGVKTAVSAQNQLHNFLRFQQTYLELAGFINVFYRILSFIHVD